MMKKIYIFFIVIILNIKCTNNDTMPRCPYGLIALNRETYNEAKKDMNNSEIDYLNKEFDILVLYCITEENKGESETSKFIKKLFPPNTKW